MMRFFSRSDLWDRFSCRDLMLRSPARGLLVFLGLLLVIAIIAIVVVLVVRLSRKPIQSGQEQSGHTMPYRHVTQGESGPVADRNQALAILNERYARGEIDDEDYQRRKKNLLGG
jgi:uncharacterized membrane protein